MLFSCQLAASTSPPPPQWCREQRHGWTQDGRWLLSDGVSSVDGASACLGGCGEGRDGQLRERVSGRMDGEDSSGRG